jgi:ribonucleotide reductase beta subunit family protein with ferritin-like domain
MSSMANDDSNLDFDDEELERFAFLPIKDQKLHELYEEQKNMMWTVSDIDFSHDRGHWDRLDNDTRCYIKFLLSLFAQLDGIVNENLVENFKKETGGFSKDCSKFYAYQEAIEWTHNETYSFLINTLIRDEQEQKLSLNSIKHVPAIREIARWAKKWMSRKLPLVERIVAFACIEGIIFSSAFAGIYYIKRRNILHGLTKANEWIARDEALHTKFAVMLYHHITSIWKKAPLLTAERVHAIVESAVGVTEMFTKTAMNVHLVGINADDMVSYVKCTSDVLCESLGYPPLYNVANPFDWMAIISLPNKTNFFESRVSEYAKESGTETFVFDISAEF